MSGHGVSLKAALALAQRTGWALGGLPAPDDGEPHGPGAPVMSGAILVRALELLRQSYKPQPQPWKGGDVGKPQPDPWRSAFAVAVGRAAAEQAIHIAATGAAIGGEVGAHMTKASAHGIAQFLDDYCGTPPRRPWPLPHGYDHSFDNADLLLVAGQFSAAAAMADVPGLHDAADRVAATALG